MAFQTEIGIPDRQHLGIDGSVRVMAGGAALAQRFVFENVRSSLGRMALQTAIILRKQSGSAGKVRRAFMRRMTFYATHLSFGNRVMTRQIEPPSNIGMALVADCFRGTGRWNRQTGIQASLWTSRGKSVRRKNLSTRV
jgi:uncharacterized membrane-anchored protein